MHPIDFSALKPIVRLAIVLEKAPEDFIRDLNPGNIKEEFTRMVDDGIFELIEFDSNIHKYVNLKPKHFAGRRSDERVCLIIITQDESMHTYYLA